MKKQIKVIAGVLVLTCVLLCGCNGPVKISREQYTKALQTTGYTVIGRQSNIIERDTFTLLATTDSDYVNAENNYQDYVGVAQLVFFASLLAKNPDFDIYSETPIKCIITLGESGSKTTFEVVMRFGVENGNLVAELAYRILSMESGHALGADGEISVTNSQFAKVSVSYDFSADKLISFVLMFRFQLNEYSEMRKVIYENNELLFLKESSDLFQNFKMEISALHESYLSEQRETTDMDFSDDFNTAERMIYDALE